MSWCQRKTERKGEMTRLSSRCGEECGNTPLTDTERKKCVSWGLAKEETAKTRTVPKSFYKDGNWAGSWGT